MSSPEVTIVREETAVGGRYVAKVAGIEGEGELTFRRQGTDVRVAVHTGVPDVFRGLGLGRALVTRLVQDARAEHFKIVARCSYVEAERRKHPEWADAFQAQ